MNIKSYIQNEKPINDSGSIVLVAVYTLTTGAHIHIHFCFTSALVSLLLL